jgi:single-strand DNA-binding protein
VENMNKIILTGRLTKEVELKFSTGAKPTAIASFSIAVKRGYVNKDNPNAITADFINVKALGSKAENVAKFFTKGKPIIITGAYQVDTYNDKEGNKKYAHYVMMDTFEFVDKDNSDTTQQSATPKQNKPKDSFEFDFDSEATPIADEDIPF